MSIKNHKSILLLMIFTSPLSTLYWTIPNFPIAITPYRIAFVLAASVFALSLFASGGKIIVPKPLFNTICILLLIYTTSLLRTETMYRNQAVFVYLQAVMFYLTVIMIVHFTNSIDSFCFSVRALLFTAVMVVFISFIDLFLKIQLGINFLDYLTDYKLPSEFIAAHRMEGMLIPRISGTFPDANLFAFYLFLPLGVTFSWTVFKERGNAISTHFLMFVLFFLAICASLSRSGTLTSLGILFLILFFSNGKVNVCRGIKYVLLLSLFILGFSICFKNVFQISLIPVFTSRFNGESAVYGIINEGRYLRGVAGWEAFLTNIFFGVGLGNLGYFLPSGLKRIEIISSHSFYLNILATMGLLGLILVFLFFVYIFRKLLNMEQDPLKLRLCFIYVMIGLFLSQILYSNMYHPALAVQFGLMGSYAKIG